MEVIYIFAAIFLALHVMADLKLLAVIVAIGVILFLLRPFLSADPKKQKDRNIERFISKVETLDAKRAAARRKRDLKMFGRPPVGDAPKRQAFDRKTVRPYLTTKD